MRKTFACPALVHECVASTLRLKADLKPAQDTDYGGDSFRAIDGVLDCDVRILTTEMHPARCMILFMATSEGGSPRSCASRVFNVLDALAHPKHAQMSKLDLCRRDA